MSKTIASLLFVSGLCVTPLPTGAVVNPTSTAYAAVEEQMVTTFEEAEDIVYVDLSAEEEIDTAATSETGQDILSSAPTTGFATAIEPVVETTQSGIATSPGIAEEPEVVESIARIAPIADEPAQTASDTTDMANVSQMVSSFDDMNGKQVMDRDGELIGTVIGVDDETTTIKVELTDGRTIALLDLPVDLGNGFVSVDLADVELNPVVDADDLLRIDCQ